LKSYFTITIGFMVASVIGCGSSAQHWGKQQFDLSIGVNDCYKHGYQPDQLVIVNFPSKFDKQRMDTILKTRPKKVFTHTVQWKKHFSNVELLHLSPFTGYVRDNMIYSSKTSKVPRILFYLESISLITKLTVKGKRTEIMK
jgi:hypothetical protein